MRYANCMQKWQFLSLLIAMDGSRDKASIQNIYTCKCTCSDCQKIYFFFIFIETLKQKSKNICPAGAELSHAEGPTDE